MIAEIYLVEFYSRSRAVAVFFGVVSFCNGRLRVKHLVYSCRTSRRLCEDNNKVCNNHKGEQDLIHIVYKCDNLTLCKVADIYRESAEPYYCNDCKVQYDSVDRAEQC